MVPPLQVMTGSYSVFQIWRISFRKGGTIVGIVFTGDRPISGSTSTSLKPAGMPSSGIINSWHGITALAKRLPEVIVHWVSLLVKNLRNSQAASGWAALVGMAYELHETEVTWPFLPPG